MNLYRVMWLDTSGLLQKGVTEATDIYQAIHYGSYPSGYVGPLLSVSCQSGTVNSFPVVRIELMVGAMPEEETG